MVFGEEDISEEEAFNQLFSKTVRIEAAGGLVTNKQGEYLMIFRNGRWDLPKGKQEDGEDIAITALREVSEECGILEVELSEHICNTYHTFHRNNKFFLKCTHWYSMEYCGDSSCVKPQTEEDIEKVIWATESELQNYLTNTYPSIKEVFENCRRSSRSPKIIYK